MRLWYFLTIAAVAVVILLFWISRHIGEPETQALSPEFLVENFEVIALVHPKSSDTLATLGELEFGKRAFKLSLVQHTLSVQKGLKGVQEDSLMLLWQLVALQLPEGLVIHGYHFDTDAVNLVYGNPIRRGHEIEHLFELTGWLGQSDVTEIRKNLANEADQQAFDEGEFRQCLASALDSLPPSRRVIVNTFDGFYTSKSFIKDDLQVAWEANIWFADYMSRQEYVKKIQHLVTGMHVDE